MKSVNIFLLSLFLCMITARSGKTILDGRVTPVVVDSMYTFTDYEWARGEVYFNAGFIVPINTTAILGIDVPFKGGMRLSAYAGSLAELGTIILEKPLIKISGNTLGSCIFKTLNGYEGIVSGFTDFGDRFVVSGNVTLDLNGAGVYVYSHNTQGPYLQPGFMLDSTVASTLRLRNGTLVESVDFNRGGPSHLFDATPTAGRHKLYLENITMFYGGASSVSPPAMTFSEDIDLIIDQGTTSFYGPRGGAVNIYGTLKVNDFGILQAGPDLNFNIKSVAPDASYFDIAPYGKLFLTNNSLTFTCPLRLPAVLGEQNTYGRIIVDGKCGLRGISASGPLAFQLGAGPQLTYTYDAMIDILPFSTLTLDNVAFSNKNLIL